MSAPIMSRKYALLILETIARRGSATYYEIGRDLRSLAKPSSFHPVLMLLRDHEPKLLDVHEDTTSKVVKYRYSLTVEGEKKLREAQRTRLREQWMMSAKEHEFVELALGILRLLHEQPATGATIAERMALEPPETVVVLRRLRLGAFITMAPDDDRHRITELGRDFLDGFKRLIEGLSQDGSFESR